MGAADVRIIFVTLDRTPYSVDQGPELTLGSQEYEVATGKRTRASARSRRGGQHYRVVAVPIDDGQALVLVQSLDAAGSTCSAGSAW